MRNGDNVDKRHINLRLLIDEKGLKHREVTKMTTMTPALFSHKKSILTKVMVL